MDCDLIAGVRCLGMGNEAAMKFGAEETMIVLLVMFGILLLVVAAL